MAVTDSAACLAACSIVRSMLGWRFRKRVRFTLPVLASEAFESWCVKVRALPTCCQRKSCCFVLLSDRGSLSARLVYECTPTGTTASRVTSGDHESVWQAMHMHHASSQYHKALIGAGHQLAAHLCCQMCRGR